MATGRMLNKSISIDAQVNSLRVDDVINLHPAEVQLFFTWCIPHLDPYGVLTSDPALLRSLVFPRKDLSLVQIQAMVDAICSCGLVEKFEVGFDTWLWFKGFTKNNANLTPSLEGTHDYPYPPNLSAEECAEEDYRRADNRRKAAESMANLRSKRAQANGETPKPRKSSKNSESPELVSLRGYFYSLAKVAPDSHRSGPYTTYCVQWRQPLESILVECSNDLTKAQKLLAAEIRIAQNDGMHIKTPLSVQYTHAKALESLTRSGDNNRPGNHYD